MENSKLLSCPNYFISWLKDCNSENTDPDFPDENLTKLMIKSIYKLTGKQFDSSDDNDYHNRATNTYEDASEENDQNHAMMLQKTMSPLIEAFLRIRLGDFDTFKKNMDWVQDRLEKLKHFKNSETIKNYTRGIEFLFNLLKCHNDILHDVMDADAEINAKEEMNKFEDFSDKEKSMIMMARWMLEESFRYENCVPVEQSIGHLREISELDPECWVWQYVLCNRLRYRRRADGDLKPSEEEITAITLSAKNAPEGRYQTMCMAGVCQCLAEIIKWNSYHNRHQNYHGPIHIGDMTFQNAKSGIEHIKQRASALIESLADKPDEVLSGPCAAEFVRYGEIFSNLLPRAYRDYEMARKCLHLRFAIKKNGSFNSSKARHKMGTLELIGFQNIEKALEFLGNAVELQNGNFPALVDLIKTFLSSVQEYDKKLEEKFSQAYENRKFWSERQFLTLKFLEGCYYFLKKEIQKAVDCWILVIQNSNPPQDFHNQTFASLKGIANRHLWSVRLSKDKILQGIKNVMDLDFEKKDIQKLLSRIEEEMKERPIPQSNRFDCGDLRRSILDGQNIPGRQNQRRQRFTVTPTEADEDNYWRQNLTISPGADTTSTQRSYPPQNQRFRVTPVLMQTRNNRNQ